MSDNSRIYNIETELIVEGSLLAVQEQEGKDGLAEHFPFLVQDYLHISLWNKV